MECLWWRLFFYPRFPPVHALWFSSAIALIVLWKIRDPACWKVGINFRVLPFQYIDGCFDQLTKIMRKDFGGQPHRNPFHTLRQQQGKFYRKSYGFFFSSVIRKLPLRSLGIVHDVQGKLGRPYFYVSWRCGRVACAHVAPVCPGVINIRRNKKNKKKKRKNKKKKKKKQIKISFCPRFTVASPIAASPCGWYCMVLPITLATLLKRPSSISFKRAWSCAELV